MKRQSGVTGNPAGGPEARAVAGERGHAEGAGRRIEATPAARIHLTIDRLTVRGMDPADGRALAASLKTELGKLLADPARRAALASSRRTPVLKLGRMPLTPGLAGSRSLGAEIARGIGRSMKP